MDASVLSSLRALFGDQLQENIPLAGYTAARIGGPADVLITVRSAEELAAAVGKMWELDMRFTLLGGGSNVLVSDKGVRGVVIINRARQIKFFSRRQPPIVHAESGVTPNDLAQRALRLGLAGFEWATAIPGTLGGTVYGNAGAFGGDISCSLVSTEIIHREHGRQVWTREQMAYGYRTSLLKREHPPVVILSANLALSHDDPQAIQARMMKNSEQRRANQPAGASMGSMFKNPANEKAGRLIEKAGLKGRRIGNAEISAKHGNFFISDGLTRAEDMKALMDLAQKTVFDQFGVHLEPEIEIIGDW